VAKLNIGYFLEDVGHENFIKSLVIRVASEMRFPYGDVNHDVRNATAGKGTTMTELKRFLRDVKSGEELPFAILIVAIDGNCQTYREKRDEISKIAQQTGYPGALVCAIPDPHIERWYLIDKEAFCQVVETDVYPKVPSYKCEKGIYKKAMKESFAKTGIVPPLGGIEYGEDIALKIDFYIAQRADAAFKHFLNGLRTNLRRYTH